MNSGRKRKIAINIPDAMVKDKIKAIEPVNCHVRKVTVITSTFCNTKITVTAPSNNPNIKSINMY